MQPKPILFQIGPVAIYWYGVLIVTGAMLAAHIVSKLSRRNGHDPEIAWNLLLVCLLTGVIGARIYHILSSWEYYRAHLGEMFGLQMSGFGIFGAFLGGLFGVWAYTRHLKLRFLEWADYCAPGLLLAQAIGRWGNFFNQELYGYPTDLPWGLYIAPEHRLPGFEAFERFHPTFLYESLLNFAGFLVLLHLARNWRKNRLYGDILFIYGIIYPVIRFFIELQRPDAWTVGGLPLAQGGVPVAQCVSVGLLVLFSCLMLVRRKLRRPSMVYAPGTPWTPPKDEAVADEAAATEEEAEPVQNRRDEATQKADSVEDVSQND